MESYRTALRYLSILERQARRPQDQVMGLVRFARMELRRGRVAWPESISTANYRNALAYFKGHTDRGFGHFRKRLDALREDAGE